jgi:hypothetical protein
MSRACSKHGRDKNAYKNLVGNPEERRLLERPRHRWEYDIRIDLREIGLEVTDWIPLAQDRDQWQALLSRVMSPYDNDI